MRGCPIYVINLDRSPERLKEITRQLEKFGLGFQRVQAVDGKLANPTQKALLDEMKYQSRHGKTSLPGELGCYLSHVRVIEVFLASDSPFAIILEDDAILEDGFIQGIEELLKHANRWDMVKLSGVHSGTPVSVLQLNQNLVLAVMFSKCTGSSAYILNRRAALELSQGLLPMTLPYDHEFDKGWKYRIKVRAVSPFLVTHNETATTTIVPTGKSSRKLTGIKRWPAYQYRVKTEFQRLAYAIGQYLKERQE
jgi:glycosyl transferase, family 25